MLTIENYPIAAEVSNLEFKYRGLYPNTFTEGTLFILQNRKST